MLKMKKNANQYKKESVILIITNIIKRRKGRKIFMKVDVRKLDKSTYHRAKMWQLAGFAGNNAACAAYNSLIGYIAYFMFGGLGIATVVAGTMLTSFRIWDAFTDPILAWLLDRTNGKIGKFRPFMIGGNIIMAISCFLIFFVSHSLPDGLSFAAFLVFYLIYVLGYTAQFICTKGAQSCLTSDPKQRTTYGMFDMLIFAVAYLGSMLLITMVYGPKYPNFGVEFFQALYPIIAIASALFTIMAVAAIWEWDRTEYFGLGKKDTQKIGLKDYVDVIKHNHAIQMMILSTSSDRLTGNVATNATINIVLYGIICGNFAMAGMVGLGASLLSIPIVMLFLNYAKKKDSRQAMIVQSWIGIIVLVLTLVLLLFCDPVLSTSPLNVFTVVFLILRILYQACASTSSTLVNPMCGDCADYEVYLTGRYCPGLMGSLYSGLDKFIGSFTTLIVAGCFALIGFTESLPTLETQNSPAILGMCLFCLCGLPIIGFLINIFAMKKYPLNKEKLEEIADKIIELKTDAVEE